VTAKRCFDLVGATLALVVLSPVVAIVALLVRLRLGRPVLFRQTRPGRHGQPFRLVKFRTMTDALTDCGSSRLDSLPMTWVVRSDGVTRGV
jgi:lipopolysaccharide/colanic/teichoic acid biosynthesis glycosyltransferase